MLQQEISLKSLTLEGLGTLEIKAIKVAFTYLSSLPDLKKDWTTLIVSRPTILHAFLKKPTSKPSKPGALLSLRDKGTFRILSSLTGVSRLMVWEEDNRRGRASQKKK